MDPASIVKRMPNYCAERALPHPLRYLGGSLARTSLELPNTNVPRIIVAWPGDVQKNT